MGGDKKHRNEEQTLARDSQKGGAESVADGLGHHVAHGQKSVHPHGGYLQAQCQRTDGNDFRIIFPEQADYMTGDQEAARAHHNQYAGGKFHAEPVGLADPAVFPGAVGKSAHGLEPLAEADDS